MSSTSSDWKTCSSAALDEIADANRTPKYYCHMCKDPLDAYAE